MSLLVYPCTHTGMYFFQLGVALVGRRWFLSQNDLVNSIGLCMMASACRAILAITNVPSFERHDRRRIIDAARREI
eukprot:2814608-Pleurochrysis_carterae.AAC.2